MGVKGMDMKQHDKYLCAALKCEGELLSQIMVSGYPENSFPELYECLMDHVWFEVSSKNTKQGEVKGVFKWVPHENGAGEWVPYEQDDQEVKV